MAEIITMPRLSDTMTDGKVSKWHKKIGDAVKEGDLLAEIETDKAIQDFESEFSGTLLYVGTEEGNSSKVDAILAIIGEKNEDISSYLSSSSQPKTETKTEIVVEKSSKPENVNVNIITMPRLSDTMTDGKVAKWHKNVGDAVKEGDLLADVETDKAIQEFESEFSGTLLYQGVTEGNAAKVDSILAIIGEKGTDISTVVANFGTTQNNSIPEKSAEKPQSTITDITQKSAENNSTNRIFISPLAKKLASEKGIDITTVIGSGENGRIVKKDIDSYSPNSVSSQTVSHQIPIIQGVDSETPNSQVRNIIAKRLSESKFTAPHYYLTIELNMDNAIASRAQLNALPNTKISFNDLVIKASAFALRSHKQVNSSWTNEKIIHHGNINIGVAVAIEDGLLVPVLKNADYLSLTQISASVKDLALRSKDRKLKADEMEGSTFSISNLGMFGIESFTSIINQPNSCILSVGAIMEKPIVKNGQIVIGNTMKVTLACDHRVVDGATGAQFLQTFKQYIENPIAMLA